MTFVEEELSTEQNPTKFSFDNIFNLEKLLEHKIFLLFIVIALVGVGFIMWRSFRTKSSSSSMDDEEIDKGTQEMMDELGVNLSKKALEEHLTSSDDDDDEKNHESDDPNFIGDNDNHIETLSNDLNNLEAYTQNSTDGI